MIVGLCCEPREINLPEWLSEVDKLIPGFSRKYLHHPLSKPINKEPKLIVKHISSNDGTETISIYSFTVDQNARYHKPRFEIPRNQEPKLSHMDFLESRIEFVNPVLKCSLPSGEEITFVAQETLPYACTFEVTSQNVRNGLIDCYIDVNENAEHFIGKTIKLSLVMGDGSDYLISDNFQVPEHRVAVVTN